MGDPLVELERVVDWEAFRPLLSRIHDKPRKSNARRKPQDQLGRRRVALVGKTGEKASKGHGCPLDEEERQKPFRLQESYWRGQPLQADSDVRRHAGLGARKSTARRTGRSEQQQRRRVGRCGVSKRGIPRGAGRRRLSSSHPAQRPARPTTHTTRTKRKPHAQQNAKSRGTCFRYPIADGRRPDDSNDRAAASEGKNRPEKLGVQHEPIEVPTSAAKSFDGRRIMRDKAGVRPNRKSNPFDFDRVFNPQAESRTK